MAGNVKLMTSAGGGVVLDTATTTATDVTVKVPVTGVNNGTLVCSDSSGNVGIGTSSPQQKLQVYSSAASGGQIQVTNSSTGAASTDGVLFGYDGSNDVIINNQEATATKFYTSAAERMRIDSSGNLLVGITSSPAISGVPSNSAVVNSGTGGNWALGVQNTAASGGARGVAVNYSAQAPNNTQSECFFFNDNAAYRFSVRSNGGIANYQANDVNLSDRREKTNFAPAKDYLDVICNIPVQTFNYIDQNMDEDPGLTLGVIAQDVQAVAPELVSESDWGVGEEPKMRLSIYQTDIQYALMKCIQELSAKNDALEARIATLEAK